MRVPITGQQAQFVMAIVVAPVWADMVEGRSRVGVCECGGRVSAPSKLKVGEAQNDPRYHLPIRNMGS